MKINDVVKRSTREWLSKVQEFALFTEKGNTFSTLSLPLLSCTESQCTEVALNWLLIFFATVDLER